jgi:hypothetical protein
LTLLIKLLLASSDKLGYTAPELNLQNHYSPTRVLGKGHNSIAYEATTSQPGKAAERHAVKVSVTVTTEHAFDNHMISWLFSG